MNIVNPELSTWPSPSGSITASSDEIHIWRINLDQPDSRVEDLLKTLGLEERCRARRFHFDKDRRDFVVARGFLRSILSRYLEVEAADLRFCYGPYGKPAIDVKQNRGVRFNLSHSHRMALYAVTRKREVGIDIEYIQPDCATQEIARRFFSAFEFDVFRALPLEARLTAFFKCWTRKEAYIKATGKGLSLPLNGFDVSVAPGEPATLLRTSEDEPQRWFLSDLDPQLGYAAAIVVEGHCFTMRCWHDFNYNSC